MHASQVWQLREKAHHLMLMTHRETVGFPPKELHSLTGDIRRASVMVGTSISDWLSAQRSNQAESFLTMACAYLAQLEIDLLRAKALGYLQAECHEALLAQINETRIILLSAAPQ
jgi:four helix bundle protein